MLMKVIVLYPYLLSAWHTSLGNYEFIYEVLFLLKKKSSDLETRTLSNTIHKNKL